MLNSHQPLIGITKQIAPDTHAIHDGKIEAAKLTVFVAFVFVIEHATRLQGASQTA